MLMNALITPLMHVMLMLIVLILRAAIPVHALMGTQEMDCHVKVYIVVNSSCVLVIIIVLIICVWDNFFKALNIIITFFLSF